MEKEEKTFTKDDSEKQLVWSAIILMGLSIAFENYAPMIVFVLVWIEHFYEFVLIKKVG